MRCSKPQMEADPSPRTQADPATFGPAPRPAPVVGLKVQPTGWCPSLVRRTLLCLALLLGVCSGPAFPQAIFIFPPVKLPLVFPPMPSVPLNERLLHIPMTVSRPSGVQRLAASDGAALEQVVKLSEGRRQHRLRCRGHRWDDRTRSAGMPGQRASTGQVPGLPQRGGACRVASVTTPEAGCSTPSITAATR